MSLHVGAPPSLMQRPDRSTAKVWVAAFVMAAALYISTAQRGPQWQDSGWQQLRIISGQIQHPLGLALTHPLQYWIGQAAIRVPGVDPATAITLISSLAVAVAIANIAATLWLLTQRASTTWIPAAALALSHTLWQHATHTESYGLVAALLSTEWLCLACFTLDRNPWWLVTLAGANGLGLANHMLAALMTPLDLVLLLWAWRTRRCRGVWLLAAGEAWLVGALPYFALVAGTALASGDWAGTLHSALFGSAFAPAVLNASPDPRLLGLTLTFLLYNLPGLTIPLALWALAGRCDAPKAFFRVMAAALLVYAIFVTRYSIADQYTFAFPLYMLLALLAGLGLEDMLRRWPGNAARWLATLAAVTALWPPLIYVAAYRYASASGALDRVLANKPYRDGPRSLLVPWGLGERSADELDRKIMQMADGDALVLYEDPMMMFSLCVRQASGQAPQAIRTVDLLARRQDVEPEALVRGALGAGTRVILVPRDRERPGHEIEGVTWRRSGDLYVAQRVEP